MRRYLTLRNLALASVFLAGAGLVADGLWIKGKAVVAQVMLNQAFLSPEDAPQKPWAWADIKPIAKIEAPRLKKTNIVLDGTSGEALAFGPGHLPGTPMPGERGTSVFSAHRDTHFAWLGELRNGDEVTVEKRDGTIIRYEIRRAWIARYDAPGINADSEEHLIALTTCWPLDGKGRGPMRYIVEGVETGRKAPEKSI
jgi:sortase A